MASDVSKPGTITALLRRWRGGDEAAFDRLVPLVYEALRRVAGDQVRLAAGSQALRPTEIVHEAYLRLLDRSQDATNGELLEGTEVEVLQDRPGLALDGGRMIATEDDVAVPEDAIDDGGRSLVEHQEIDRSVRRLLQG